MECALNCDMFKFTSCVLKRIGATLTGVKPAELINISCGDDHGRQWLYTEAVLKKFSEIDYVVIKEKKRKKQGGFMGTENLPLKRTTGLRGQKMSLKNCSKAVHFCLI